MSASLSSSDLTGLFIVFLIVVLLARRTYALSQGTVYSTARVFGYGAFSSFLFIVFGASTIYVAVGTWGWVGLALIPAYADVVFAAAWIDRPRVQALVKFERREDNQLYYRLPVVIPVLTLVLFVVRVTAEGLVFGLNALFTFTFPTSLPLGSLVILIVADLVYGTSIGLLYGRGLGVRAAYLAGPAHEAPLQGS
jgi:hypothetical protein